MLSSLRRLLPGVLLIAAASAVLLLTDRSSPRNEMQQREGSARRIAIIQYASIEAFEAGKRGLLRHLAEVGYSRASGCTIDEFNAEGDQGTLAQISAQATRSAEPYDLVITLGTAATQSFVKSNRADLPHVFGIVASPPAINIPLGPFVPETGRPSRCCGVGTLQPVELMFRDFTACAPKKSLRVGCVWNPAEPNAEANVRIGKSVCATLGIEFVGANGANVSEVVAACESVLARGVDAFWLPPDVTVSGAARTMIDRCGKAHVPAISNFPEMVAFGAALSEGSDWDALGVTTGVYAELVLDGVSPSALPIEDFVPTTLAVDLSRFGTDWRVPEELLARAATIVQTGTPTVTRPQPFPLAPASALALRLPRPARTSTSTTTSTSTRLPTVSVFTYSRTPNVEEAYDGFLKELAVLGYVDGSTITLTMHDAQLDMATLSTIVASIDEARPDVVVPFTTPALQAAVRKITDRPIVFSLVASGVAAGVGSSDSEHLANVTGAQSTSDWDRMIEIVKIALPNLTRAGTVFAPGEANSVYFRDAWKAKLRAAGIELISVGADRPTELPEAADALVAANVQAILQISDNASSTGFSTIVKSADRANVPVFCFASGAMKSGAALGVARDFHDVGRLSAQLVDRVLRGEKTATIPFADPTRTRVLVNPDRLRRYGITLPPSIMRDAEEVRE